MPQAATQYNIIIGSVPATARPREGGVCIGASGYGLERIRDIGKGAVRIGVSGASGRDRDIGVSGEGRGRVLASRRVLGVYPGRRAHVKACVGSASRRMSGRRAHVKVRVRGGCVRVSGVRQEVRRAHIGSIREGRRARERRPYCDIVIFFEKICFLGKKPYLCNASLDRFDPKIGHLF